MNLIEVAERNYAAQLKRGTITPESTVEDCIDDLAGEVLELYEEDPTSENFLKEAADVVLNLLSVVIKAGIPIGELSLAIQAKVEYNEIR